MNLIEAIKSGRRRRNPQSPVSENRIWHDAGYPYPFADVVAETWEIEEPTVTVTRTQFLEAFGMCFGTQRPNDVMPTELALELARRLGLEER